MRSYSTLSIHLYRRVSWGDEADDQQQAGMPGEGGCRMSSVSLTPAIQVFIGLPLTLKPAILVLYALRASWFVDMRVRCPNHLILC